MILSYKQQDIHAGREITDDYVDWEHMLGLYENESRVCHVCCKGMTLAKHNENKWTLDRNDNSIGHTKDNCTPMCLKCNRAKSNAQNLF